MIFATVQGEVPLVSRVWTARSEESADFTSMAKGATMIVFAQSDDQVSVHVRGPETKGTRLTCPGGWDFFGVELRLGAYLPLHPARSLVDMNDALLPTPGPGRVVIDRREWEMPTVQNVDVFVDRLIRADLLAFDPLIEEIRRGARPRSVSERTAQYRFLRAVGISHRALSGIDRARAAARALRSGCTIADAIVAGAYYDQPQLTRAIRRAGAHTPAELRRGTAFLAF